MNKRAELINQINTSQSNELTKNIRMVNKYCSKSNRFSFTEIWNKVMPVIKGQADSKVVKDLLDKEQKSVRKEDDPARYHLAESLVLLSDIFVKANEEESRRVLYKVKDMERKIVEPIPEVRQTMRLKEAIRQIGFDKKEKCYTNSEANEMVSQWLDCRLGHISKPEPMLPPEVDGWCLHRPEVLPDSTGEIPTWLTVLNRMDDPKAFSAWIWGVYMGIYEGRQILWLYGPSGEDGKSAILKIIGEELFGPALGAIDNTQIGKKSGFLNSFFVNTKLVIYPDCKNKKVLMTEAFQSIANGGIDMVVVEPKGEKAYFSCLKARAAIASNYLPEITGNNFSVSRLLLVELGQATEERTSFKEYGGRLRAELSGFLAYAKDAYEELCTDNYKIQMNELSKENTVKAVGVFEEEYDYIFNKHFEFSSGAQLVGHDFIREIQEMAKIKDNQKISNFKSYMEASKNIVIENTNKGILYNNLKLKGSLTTVTNMMDIAEV